MPADELPRRARRAEARRPNDPDDEAFVRAVRKSPATRIMWLAVAASVFCLLVAGMAVYTAVVATRQALAAKRDAAVAAPAPVPPPAPQPVVTRPKREASGPAMSGTPEAAPAAPKPAPWSVPQPERPGVPRGSLDAQPPERPDPLAEVPGETPGGRGKTGPSAAPPSDGFVKPGAKPAPKTGAGGPGDAKPADGFVRPKDGETATKADVEDLGRKLRKGSNPKVRMDAAHKLRELGPLAAAASKDLCDALTDSSPAVRAAALQAIEQVRADLYKPLSELLVDDDINRRFRAAKEIGLMGEPATPCVGLLLAQLRRELAHGPDTHWENRGKLRPMQSALFDSIRQIHPDDPATLSYYKQLAAPSNTSAAARWQAINFLYLWAGTDEDRRKQVLPLALAALPDGHCQPLSIQILGDYGPLAKAAAPMLRQLKLSGSSEVREAAARALDKVEGR